MNEEKGHRVFTPEQQVEILKASETAQPVKVEGNEYELCHSGYHWWKRQLDLGVRASQRSSKPLKTPDH